MLRKFILVAGLAVLEGGSSTQLFLAILVAFSYLVLILHLVPLKKTKANRMNVVANIQIFLSLLVGLVLKTEQPLPGSFEASARRAPCATQPDLDF